MTKQLYEFTFSETLNVVPHPPCVCGDNRNPRAG